SVLLLLLFPVLTPAQHYQQTNLVSDIAGMASITDPNLKNPWGISPGSTTPANPNGSPWWVGNNNSGTSTIYNGSGNPANFFPDPHPDSNGNGINSPFNNFVMVPPPGFAPGAQSAPTGVVFNGSPTDFQVAPGKQAIFIFATEDGTISGWNPGANPPASVTNAILKVDHSDHGSADGAVYKGMTRSAARALVSSNSSLPPVVTSGSSSMAIGSTLLGASCGPVVTSANSATPFLSAISAAAGSPPSTASRANSSAL